MTEPNFLLIGPPKCATSSLHGAICNHAGVAQGVRKELFFLMDRGHPLAGRPNLQDDGMASFGAAFPDAANDAAIRIDSTTHYLYQQAALDFARRRPDVRACVVLRDPAERVFSSYNYTRNNLAALKSELSFAQYVELVDARQPLYPRYCHSASSAWVLERDIDYSRYERHVAPWLDALGPERLKIVLFEDLQRNTSAVAQDIWAWLGLEPPPGPAVAAERRNETRAVKYRQFHRLVRKLNAAVPLPSGLKKHLKSGYHTLQGGAPDASDDQPAVDRLRDRFGADIDWVSKTLGRDLSHWLGKGNVR